MKLLPSIVPAFLTTTLCACVMTIGGSSCTPTRVGSGVELSEVRDVSSFSAIAVGGVANVVASVGPETRVTVTCDDNLVQYVRTEVRGDTLHVELEGGSYQFDEPLMIAVVSPRLERVSVSGAADASVSGVDTDEFTGQVSGAASLSVSGRVDRVEARASGAGSMDLSGLVARTGDVRVSGASDVQVNAHESLSARASGASSVEFAGAPKLSSEVSGAASVKRR